MQHSCSKTMTSALIQLLVQDGKVRLTDPVSDYVPGVPNGARITLAELLEMRSGLYDYTDAPESGGRPLAQQFRDRPRTP